ncbi:MAG: hypothetical protein JWM41_149 [Gemmatimonadetes bacterium]|nr:hypothetical protein [Gemmatimonadota bacterium]
MTLKWTALLPIALLVAACQSASPPSLGPTPQPDSMCDSVRDSVTHQFYSGKSYGTESQFNPLSLIINGGFDELRVKQNRDIFNLPYGSMFHTVFYTVTHPEPVLRHYGYQNWLTHEVFPLSLKHAGGGQWTPNYELHLFAGGMTYYRTVEWYEQHGIGHPRLAAGFTVYAWHLLTEMIESDGRCCEDEDGLTDLYLFDSGSILLWNQAWVRRLLRDRVEFTDWPGQPTLALPSHRLENAYMLAMLRVPVPRVDELRLMTVMGSAFLIGPSVRVGHELWFSAAGGYDPAENPIIDPRTGARTATLLPSGGLFLDRNGSLLASFVTRGGASNGPTFNLYPGVIGSGRWSPGLWAQAVRGGGYRYGVVSKLGIGLGGIRAR